MRAEKRKRIPASVAPGMAARQTGAWGAPLSETAKAVWTNRRRTLRLRSVSAAGITGLSPVARRGVEAGVKLHRCCQAGNRVRHRSWSINDSERREMEIDEGKID